MADLAQLAQQSASSDRRIHRRGRFWLPGETAFNAKRRDFYGSIQWSEPIVEQVSIISAIMSRTSPSMFAAPTRR